MNKRNKEKLKDILIDHVYDYCYNEPVKKIQGKHHSYTWPSGIDIKDDDHAKSMIKKIVKEGDYKMFYDERKKTHCEVIDGTIIKADLAGKLSGFGYKKNISLSTHIEDALVFLVNRSYFARRYIPFDKEVKLTEKGLNHYKNGLSFEDEYVKNRATLNAIRISFFSLGVALIAVILSVIFKSCSS